MSGYKDLAIGIFDGLHLGHLKILNNLKNNPSVITFDPHPHKKTKLIFPIETRLAMLKNLGIAHVFVFSENDNIYELDAKDFIKNILIKNNVKNVFIGIDSKLGKNRICNANDFKTIAKEFNINVNIVEPYMYKNSKLSSSKIRTELINGNITKINKLLSYGYFISGTVAYGTKTAEKLGYKTANIYQNESTLTPCMGVYKSNCIYNNTLYKSISYIGKSPTLLNNTKTVIETHLFDFNKIIYDENITIIFKDKIRNEMKFNSKTELIKQINTLNYFFTNLF